jgi:putative transposase
MATRITTHKIRLNPTPEQEAYFRCAAGTRRFCYNWGLAEWNRQEAAYTEEQQTVPEADRKLKRPEAMALKQQFNAMREAKFPWTYDVTKCAIEGAFFDLADAFKRYASGQNQHPQFKKKGKSHESFYLANDKFTCGDHWVQIPVMGDFLLKRREATGTQTERIKNRTNYKRKLGKVNMAESLRFRVAPPEGRSVKTGKRHHARKQVWCQHVQIVGATVSYTAGHWYISIQVKIPKQEVINTRPIVGVDVGIKESAVASDGRRFENQKPLTKQLTKLRRLGRHFSKKLYDPQTKTGSQNREKLKRKLAGLHDEIACIRLDAHHKLTTTLAKTCRAVGIEDLHVKGMFKNRTLARAMADAGLGQLLRLLETKLETVGGRAIIVDRFFPSTKTCSGCGHVKKRMPLKYQTFICLQCGLHIDRDLNAAINLRNEADRLLVLLGGEPSDLGTGLDGS